MPEDLTKTLMAEVVRKVFLGVVSSIAVVGIVLNWQLQIQAKEQVTLKVNQDNMAKRLDQQEAGMTELRQMLRDMERGHRTDFDAVRNGINDLNSRFATHAQFETKVEAYLKELMVMKDEWQSTQRKQP